MSINHSTESNEKPFHSSAYASAARGDALGATSPQSFTERARIETNRKVVRSYRESLVARRRHGLRPRPDQSVNLPGRPVEPSPRPSFKEPPSRPYNPFS